MKCDLKRRGHDLKRNACDKGRDSEGEDGREIRVQDPFLQDPVELLRFVQAALNIPRIRAGQGGVQRVRCWSRVEFNARGGRMVGAVWRGK